MWYGVAMISRLLEIIRLFGEYRSLLSGSFAKETYNLKEPTNRSQPITVHVSTAVTLTVAAQSTVDSVSWERPRARCYMKVWRRRTSLCLSPVCVSVCDMTRSHVTWMISCGMTQLHVRVCVDACVCERLIHMWRDSVMHGVTRLYVVCSIDT